MRNTATITHDDAETVDLTLIVSREHAEWLDKAAATFDVPASALVSLAIAFYARNFKI